ncbi:hypothetical protein DXG01_012245, partial [Tephrocybe rancida]
RCMPSAKLAEHVAYFQPLPHTFKDFATKYHGGKKINPDLITHCNRELVHEQWRILLNDEFIEAYTHGIVVEWVGDGQKRRFYPRILTYSADYPEKLRIPPTSRLSSVSKEGAHAHDAKFPKPASIWWGPLKTGPQGSSYVTRRETITKARAYIYGPKHLAIDSAAVDRLLKPESLVPTIRTDRSCNFATLMQNAFSDRLQKCGLDYASIFVVDLLHEIELGIWKALLIHLFHILESVDENILHELDRRSVPYLSDELFLKLSIVTGFAWSQLLAVTPYDVFQGTPQS